MTARCMCALICHLIMLTACASHVTKSQSQPSMNALSASSVGSGSDTKPQGSAPPIPPSQQITQSPSLPSQGTNTQAPTAASNSPAQDDFDAIYGQSGAQNSDASGQGNENSATYDPWEGYNRRMHRFNMVVDRRIAHPLAKAYVTVLPSVAQLGVTNFFDNLGSPLTFANQILQGHPVYAVQTLGRFMLNTVLGFAGLFDPASSVGIPRRREDFGKTLAVWGWTKSRYLELPFLGPSTIRDALGSVGGATLSPLRYVDKDKARIGLQVLQLINIRAQLLSLDSIRQNAVDEYALTRDVWIQQRTYQINRDRRAFRFHHENEQLPDYLLEDHNNDPLEAIPVPERIR